MHFYLLFTLLAMKPENRRRDHVYGVRFISFLFIPYMQRLLYALFIPSNVLFETKWRDKYGK